MRTIIIWEEGSIQASETLRLTLEKMIETLFLALMATTFAVLIAIPLSLLPSRNLMTGNFHKMKMFLTLGFHQAYGLLHL